MPFDKLPTNLACSSPTGECWLSVAFSTSTTSGHISQFGPYAQLVKVNIELELPFFWDKVSYDLKAHECKLKISVNHAYYQRFDNGKMFKKPLKALSNTYRGIELLLYIQILISVLD